jgi:GNAT superfamily N-acetyltransferase
MIEDPLVRRARDLWVRLAGVPVAFPTTDAVTVVVAPASRLCPPGWTGIVVLGGAGIATAPDADAASALRAALQRLPVTAATDTARVRAELPVTDVLGPATLAYLHEADLSPRVSGAPVERATRDLDDLLAVAAPDEVAESGMDAITSDAFVVRHDGRIVAAAGHVRWLDTAAHLCVLAAPDHRGRGHARAVAAAATADAPAQGLLPQWRARPEPSRRVARALGFRELGTQLSVRL